MQPDGMKSLQRQLEEYACGTRYPFHMPGHKRRLVPAPGLNVAWDVTEVPGTDDLHAASGILREAMDRTSALFGSAQTWFLVNGSTCGLLAGIRALCPSGSAIIAARNCHKAVFHAIELQHLQAYWVYPEQDEEFDIAGSIDPEKVRRQLALHPEARAVVVTSPTYDGVISDIRSIADICHGYSVPLFIDEAHGAHLGLPERLPGHMGSTVTEIFGRSALHLGADLVVQSAHKTLPSLTQSALLHLGEDTTLVDARQVEQQLDIFETSSPSYLLMASLDGCTGLLRTRGSELFSAWADHLIWFEQQTQSLENFRIFGYGADRLRQHPAVFAFDRTKILIRTCRGEDMTTGAELAALLEEQFGIVTEMHSGRNVLALSGCGDTREGFERLAKALLAIDRQSRPLPKTPLEETNQVSEEFSPDEADRGSVASSPEETKPAGEAPVHEFADGNGEADMEAVLRAPCEVLAQSESEGRICAEYVCPYPPGVPVLIPGEVITREKLRTLCRLQDCGVRVLHSRLPEGESGQQIAVSLEAVSSLQSLCLKDKI